MKAIRQFIRNMLNFNGMDAAIQIYMESGIKTAGWLRSFETKQSVDKAGNPIPWVTYPFISFISPRLNKNMRVFEYGCGNSTLWYASKVGEVISVEHDQGWANKVTPTLPSHCKLVYKALEYGGAYSKEVSEHGLFDMVILDGRDRVNCALNAVNYLKPQGVIVIDNTDRPEYEPALAHLATLGFKRLDFEGMAPIIAHFSITTVFYRSNNCLGV